MSNSLDINLLPMFRSMGKDQTELPGLHIAEPPRRAARSRRSDHLILYLSLTGNDPLSAGKQEQILARLGHTFFKTSGSVTSALRTVAETLNKFLLDRNVKSASSGRQTIGLLTLVAIRSELYFMAQSGPVHAYWITREEVEHLYDPQLSGRGLGLSRTTPIRYFQASIKPGDTLLLAAQPSSVWTAGMMKGTHGQRLESLRRRLLHRSDTELNALLLQTQPGSGNVNLLHSPLSTTATSQEQGAEGQYAVEDLSRPLELPEELEPADATGGELEGGGQDEPETPQASEVGEGPQDGGASPEKPLHSSEHEQDEIVVSESPVVQPQRPLPDRIPPAETTGTSQTSSPAVVFESEQTVEPTPTTPRAPRRISFRPVMKALGIVGGAIATTIAWFLGGIRTLLRRMLPDEAMFSIPTTTMAFIAVAVPLVVVAVATMVYFQRGRAAQYETYFNQAVLAAQQVAVQEDIQVRREIWNETLKYLDAAENYRVTSESRQLRMQVQSRLDALELIKRVDFQPAIVGGLPDTVQVTKMVLSDGELFLLDSASGNVLRARITTSQDYDLDRAFQCGPEYAGGYGVEKLIDIAPAPLGNPSGALVFAIDKNGSMLSCFPGGDAPEPQTLTRPATAPNWGNLVAFSVDQDTGDLYLLDPLDQAVWVYWGGDVSVDPEFFFGDEVPMMEDMVDLTVDKGDLYLLHADGHTTMCTFSNWDVSPTRCVEPMPYVDSRPGKEGQSLEVDQAFSQVLSTQPPDPSLYLLQPQTQAVYHFSLRTLKYHSRFMPQELLAGKPATAMAVNQLERILFLAVDNQVFRGSMP